MGRPDGKFPMKFLALMPDPLLEKLFAAAGARNRRAACFRKSDKGQIKT